MAKKKGKNRNTALMRRVVFSHDASDAGLVLVLGDFNDWDQEKGAMKKNQKGVWKKNILIEPGTYQYKFLIDGEWQHDPKCDKTALNIHGTVNSVIRVE